MGGTGKDGRRSRVPTPREKQEARHAITILVDRLQARERKRVFLAAVIAGVIGAAGGALGVLVWLEAVK